MKCEKCGAVMEEKDGVMTCPDCGPMMPTDEMPHDSEKDTM